MAKVVGGSVGAVAKVVGGSIGAVAKVGAQWLRWVQVR